MKELNIEGEVMGLSHRSRIPQGRGPDLNWERVVPFLDFPPDVRRVIYTTNAIESLNSTLRKLLQYRGHFPTDEAVHKLRGGG